MSKSGDYAIIGCATFLIAMQIAEINYKLR